MTIIHSHLADATPLHVFRQNLPKKPYCTDDFVNEGLVIRNIQHAIERRYIQPNHPNSRLWLLYDIDRPTCVDEIVHDKMLPAPSILVQNRKTRRAHAFYGLGVGVHMNAGSSQKAIRYAASVDVGLASQIEGDPGYAGLIAKNPLHRDWDVVSQGGLYDLDELAEYLDLGFARDGRRRLPDEGLGRNCNLFNTARKWAYKQIRTFSGARKDWMQHMSDRCHWYNGQLTKPMDGREVDHIGTSIGKWVWARMSPAGFSAWQANNARRRGTAVRKKSEPKRQEVARLRGLGFTQKQIAEKLGVGLRTIERWASEG